MSEGNAATATKSGAPDPLLGRLIAGRFKIVSLLARGGMGKVYVAEQAPLGRVCALKVLNPNYVGDADPEFHRRFYREASIASKITHPNSVTIFDYGKTDDDVYYMAMELLEGQTLHQAIREAGTFPEERVGRVAAQICRALREAHLLEVIHRDLKPANIFLTRHGDGDDFVKILDFGLVKHMSERPEEQLTQTGLFMGSPKYMAPEQIQGGHVDARTDVYSLGIMMYEMLTGKVPFERPTSVNILMAHVGEPPPPMRAVNPNLVCTPLFEDLVMRCIAKDPAERYNSMDEVLQALKRAHGVSLTGQLAALTSGGWSPLTTMPPGSTPPPPMSTGNPPAVITGASGAISVRPPSANTSGQTPMGVMREGSLADGSIGLSELRPRSRLWVPLGVLGAAVLGGLLGMVVFRLSAPAPRANGGLVAATTTTASPPVTTTATAAPLAPVTSAPSSAPATLIPATRTIAITTEPPGATVREDGVELCTQTPCEVTLRGPAADTAKVHKLLVTKAGYRVEARSVRAGDAPVVIKMTRWTGGAHVAPKPTGDTPAGGANPEGYREVPY